MQISKSLIISLLYFLFFSIIILTSCHGQEKSKLSKDNKLTNVPLYGPHADSDSQIAEYIRHVFQDKNGDLWLGTNNYGVVHFNGDSLSYFSNGQGFSGSQITGMTEDPEGNLWFATDQGIVKYDWSTTEKNEKIFTNFTDRKDFERSYVWSIFADSKGTIWVGTREGLCRFDGTKLETFELPYSEEYNYGFFSNRNIWSISEDKKGNIWFGTNGNGAFKYDPSAELKGIGKSFTQYTEKDGLADNNVDCIIEDKDGNIWLGTRLGGLSKYNGKTFTNYTENDSIGNNEVCIIYEDKVGNIWISSEGFGVYRYDGTSYTNFSKKQGLGVKAVQTIFEDREGRLWVGGGGGLYRFDEKSQPGRQAGFINVTKNGPWK